MVLGTQAVSVSVSRTNNSVLQGGAKKTCLPVYRNPEGVRQNNDEYLLIFPQNLFADYFFSAYEERPPALKGKLIRDE